jgi:hypothetical protein
VYIISSFRFPELSQSAWSFPLIVNNLKEVDMFADSVPPSLSRLGLSNYTEHLTKDILPLHA